MESENNNYLYFSEWDSTGFNVNDYGQERNT